jgi:Rrf2 family protein
MRVPQRLDYVLRALTEMVLRGDGAPVVIGDLAAELRMPKRFVEQQMTALGKRGIVVCARGAGGGCRLARPAKEITVEDVVIALQGEVMDVPRIDGSAVSEMWGGAANALGLALAAVSLEDLAKRQAELDAAAQAPMYYI